MSSQKDEEELKTEREPEEKEKPEEKKNSSEDEKEPEPEAEKEENAEAKSKEESEEESEEEDEKEQEPKPEKKKGTGRLLPVLLLLAGVGVAGWFGYQYLKPESKGDRYAAQGAYPEAVAEYRTALASDPSNAGLKEKLSSSYLAWSATIEATSDWSGAYQLLQTALSDLPGDPTVSDHLEWIRGTYVREVLREVYQQGNTKQAVETLETANAQIPDERFQAAIDEIYGTQWKETSRVEYVTGGAIDRYLVRGYDEDGHEIRQTTYNGEGTVEVDQEFYYEDGRISGMIRYEGDEAVSFGEWKYEEGSGIYTEYSLGNEPLYAISYNDDGSLGFYIIYNPDESVEEYIGYEYDESGVLLAKTEYGNDDVPDLKYVREYNAAGQLQRETKQDGSGSVQEYREFTYDAQGNVTGISRRDAADGLIDRQNYVYDAGGNLTLCEMADPDGEITEKNEYEYDADGNLTRELVYGAYEVCYRIYEYEYDTDGNLVKKTEYYGDGILKGWTEYTYEFHELP